ncbi:Hypothetical predicted protein [Olea europaea subsp. europaea]|uniref:Secreted protein n=1 Tax=Olea europaea subsp. europaea TaxID=158383 RepID=A0A8S0RDE0_OLEEU|nr:Hypothetical predicted protein [Olea europaea subsp. europaea]
MLRVALTISIHFLVLVCVFTPRVHDETGVIGQERPGGTPCMMRPVVRGSTFQFSAPSRAWLPVCVDTGRPGDRPSCWLKSRVRSQARPFPGPRGYRRDNQPQPPAAPGTRAWGSRPTNVTRSAMASSISGCSTPFGSEDTAEVTFWKGPGRILRPAHCWKRVEARSVEFSLQHALE